MTKRTTWNNGELRKLYRIYRYTFAGLEQVRNPSGKSAEVAAGDRRKGHGYTKQTGKKEKKRKKRNGHYRNKNTHLIWSPGLHSFSTITIKLR